MKLRTYSVFVKENESWTRITPLALFLPKARQTFQGALISGSMRGMNIQLRPADEDFNKADEYRANKTRLFGEVK